MIDMNKENLSQLVMGKGRNKNQETYEYLDYLNKQFKNRNLQEIIDTLRKEEINLLKTIEPNTGIDTTNDAEYVIQATKIMRPEMFKINSDSELERITNIEAFFLILSTTNFLQKAFSSTGQVFSTRLIDAINNVSPSTFEFGGSSDQDKEKIKGDLLKMVVLNETPDYLDTQMKGIQLKFKDDSGQPYFDSQSGQNFLSSKSPSSIKYYIKQNYNERIKVTATLNNQESEPYVFFIPQKKGSYDQIINDLNQEMEDKKIGSFKNKVGQKSFELETPLNLGSSYNKRKDIDIKLKNVIIWYFKRQKQNFKNMNFGFSNQLQIDWFKLFYNRFFSNPQIPGRQGAPKSYKDIYNKLNKNDQEVIKQAWDWERGYYKAIQKVLKGKNPVTLFIEAAKTILEQMKQQGDVLNFGFVQEVKFNKKLIEKAEQAFNDKEDNLRKFLSEDEKHRQFLLELVSTVGMTGKTGIIGEWLGTFQLGKIKDITVSWTGKKTDEGERSGESFQDIVASYDYQDKEKNTTTKQDFGINIKHYLEQEKTFSLYTDSSIPFKSNILASNYLITSQTDGEINLLNLNLLHYYSESGYKPTLLNFLTSFVPEFLRMRYKNKYNYFYLLSNFYFPSSVILKCAQEAVNNKDFYSFDKPNTMKRPKLLDFQNQNEVQLNYGLKNKYLNTLLTNVENLYKREVNPNGKTI